MSGPPSTIWAPAPSIGCGRAVSFQSSPACPGSVPAGSLTISPTEIIPVSRPPRFTSAVLFSTTSSSRVDRCSPGRIRPGWPALTCWNRPAAGEHLGALAGLRQPAARVADRSDDLAHDRRRDADRPQVRLRRQHGGESFGVVLEQRLGGDPAGLLGADPLPLVDLQVAVGVHAPAGPAEVHPAEVVVLVAPLGPVGVPLAVDLQALVVELEQVDGAVAVGVEQPAERLPLRADDDVAGRVPRDRLHLAAVPLLPGGRLDVDPRPAREAGLVSGVHDPLHRHLRGGGGGEQQGREEGRGGRGGEAGRTGHRGGGLGVGEVPVGRTGPTVYGRARGAVSGSSGRLLSHSAPASTRGRRISGTPPPRPAPAPRRPTIRTNPPRTRTAAAPRTARRPPTPPPPRRTGTARNWARGRGVRREPADRHLRSRRKFVRHHPRPRRRDRLDPHPSRAAL